MTLRNRLQTGKDQPPPTAGQPTPAAPPPAASTPASEPPRPKPGGLSDEDYNRLKKWLLSKIAGRMEDNVDLARTPQVLQMLRERFNLVYGQANVSLPSAMIEDMFNEVVDEIVGFGPIEKLLRDPTISEVMVNGPSKSTSNAKAARRLRRDL